MPADTTRPIIIRKVIEEGHHAHHGGAWKVAYADFVTAMMAFFLLLWLISSASEDTLKGLSEYFSEADQNQLSGEVQNSGLWDLAILNGETLFEVPGDPFSQSSGRMVQIVPSERAGSMHDDELEATDASEWREHLSDEAFEAERERREQEQFEEAKAAILENLSGSNELSEYRENLIIEPTPEGLRIEILDRDGKPMFPLGSDDMFDHTKGVIRIVVESIADLPHKISIEGHTDAWPYVEGANYDNWHLSTDRAHATRLELLIDGLGAERIAEVVGKGDADLLLPEAPKDPRNRRISILLLREHPADPKEPSKLGADAVPNEVAASEERETD